MKNIIESVRKERHINQETLARAVGVSRQTIISIERGKCVPSVAIALRIARFFGVTVEDLFVGDDACFWNLSPSRMPISLKILPLCLTVDRSADKGK